MSRNPPPHSHREANDPITGPTTAAARSNHLSGKKLFNIFIEWGTTEHEIRQRKRPPEIYEYRKEVIANFNELVSDQVTQLLFNSIAGWLADRVKRVDEGGKVEYYTPNGTLQYLSNIYMAVFGKFKEHRLKINMPMTLDGNPKWYIELRYYLQGLVCARTIDAGDSLLKQSEKIERALNIRLQGALMKQNTKHSYGMHAALTTEAQGCSRASENGLQCWHRASFNFDKGCTEMHWVCAKTKSEKYLSLWDDWENYVLSFPHAMACLWLAGNGRDQLHADANKDENWMFVKLALVSDVSGLLNTAIRSVRDQVPEISSNHTSKGYRNGGGDYILATEGK
jgi:hypothetical protein